jgi:hypothetical protein
MNNLNVISVMSRITGNGAIEKTRRVLIIAEHLKELEKKKKESGE